jgi:hypothetical protein
MLHRYMSPGHQRRYRLASGLAGLGVTNDWDAFIQGGRSATYEDPQKVVYCSKDSANGAQCHLEAELTIAARQAGPVAAMQRAADAVLNQAKGLHTSLVLQGKQLKMILPDGTERALSQNDWDLNPILVQAGYDGIVGSQTRGLLALALMIAGSVYGNIPSTVEAAFASGRSSDFVFYAQAIADFLTYVGSNWASLEQSYREHVTANPGVVPEVVPAVAAALYQKKKFPLALAIGGGLAAVALVVGLGYAFRKPQMTEEMY